MTTSLATDTLKQFRVIIGAVRHHFRVLETACGISGAQVWILSAIQENPGIKVSSLSGMLAIHISTASNMLDKLEKAGLVKRQRGTTDRRVVTVQLTREGVAILDRAPKPLTGLVPHALEHMPENLLQRLHEDLAVLIRQMELIDDGSASKPLSALLG
jgi:DNA-binding MarR family transcriptional regulator